MKYIRLKQLKKKKPIISIQITLSDQKKIQLQHIGEAVNFVDLQRKKTVNNFEDFYKLITCTVSGLLLFNKSK